MFTQAITRKPGRDFAEGLTSAALGRPEYDLMLSQHAAYVKALASLGMEVSVLEPLPGFPDAYFVEDVAVVTPEIAVITKPGAAERQGEEEAIEPVLAQHKPLALIQLPGTLDGGDVLIIGKRAFVGLSARSNHAGFQQLAASLEEFGYACVPVEVEAGLHLKSSVNYVGEDTLLLTAGYAKRSEFKDFQQIILDEDEAYAANSLWINDNLLMPQSFPKTREKLESLGLKIIELDVSEARKMDGGLTCMSLRL